MLHTALPGLRVSGTLIVNRTALTTKNYPAPNTLIVLRLKTPALKSSCANNFAPELETKDAGELELKN